MEDPGRELEQIEEQEGGVPAAAPPEPEDVTGDDGPAGVGEGSAATDGPTEEERVAPPPESAGS